MFTGRGREKDTGCHCVEQASAERSRSRNNSTNVFVRIITNNNVFARLVRLLLEGPRGLDFEEPTLKRKAHGAPKEIGHNKILRTISNMFVELLEWVQLAANGGCVASWQSLGVGQGRRCLLSLG